ncbi:MIF4G-like, type 3 domain and Amino acid transporter, transmembrane family and MIF4-like, type 1/2/3 domain and Armadillo-type fold domain-containing protein [Strongyloides ratti]|uniref:MIF4G-like, type 3 domain and Amino acid transporter, transmembrane family and MIF4-like, type 1/2/3 domain and Armadillo-type fold domain-containing protein n=1 Tax=Strongyloides ratti TaxID=34506 RepID=A0A090L185_STRRB|nr:MIF4G-like, type 3 domain and Amino acid transporter, transmembrane family and MIF4-like, type 1/2/3 domain and Armadillo-type fold domain-containing protein [Strongyloides ratti]CEF63550.1 MIF4G-like, type 3 domain and Amino acid transporter, transmembrane family and MIF4-like, type 1/2/3 domain and Armadillo-type fold domain-containing protein [Strongyloides ratti]
MDNKECFINFLKGMIGPGILSLSMAFKDAGLITASITIIIIGIINTYCMIKLIECSKYFSIKYKIKKIDYGSLAYYASKEIMKKDTIKTKIFPIIVWICLLSLQIGICSVFYVFVGTLTKELVEKNYSNIIYDIRLYYIGYLIPFIILGSFKSIRTLTFLNLFANILLGLSLLSIFFILILSKHSYSEIKYYTNINGIFTSLGTIMYAFEGQALVIPLANHMKEDNNMIKILIYGMMIITVIAESSDFKIIMCDSDQLKNNENIVDEGNVVLRKKKPTLQIYKPPCSRSSTIEDEKNDNTYSITNNSSNIKGSSLNQSGKLKENNNKNHSKISNALISTTMKEFPKKKVFGSKEIEEITNGLKRINAIKDTTLIDDFLSSNMTNSKISSELGLFLVKFAVEENRVEAKNTAKICAHLLDCPTGDPFHKNLINSLKQYFECRDQLRENHFKIWTTFINFINETFANIGFTYEGDLVELIFTTFEYLLLPPTLHNLRIEELECLISGLLAIGYDLERVCPEKLGSLKELIRDALIEVQEPWARKMIMLLMELGASGWKLPTEANEYYFH